MDYQKTNTIISNNIHVHVIDLCGQVVRYQLSKNGRLYKQDC